jgi:energy-coupling factor transporter ATP-binding protein EcfA2
MLLQKRIYEWSKGLPDWQRDLLRRVASGALDETGHREVLRILAGAADAPVPIALALEDLPADEGEHGQVELRAIRELCNINCLAPGQELKLAPGLNAVYGDNGSGKSGYGRLLRRVTRSGEPEEILRDVFDPGTATGAQTAHFDIAVDDADQPVPVDLSADPDRVLSAMAAFDASRARLFLTKPNVIEHVPRALRVLRALSQTQDELAETLRELAQRRRAALPALPEIQETTAAGKALTELDASSDVAALVSLIELTADEQSRLQELEQAAAAIRSDQSRQLESAAKTLASNTRSAAQRLADADALLNDATIAALAQMRKRLDDVNAAERSLADDAFADQRFDATGQGQWREMWFAAERFAEAAGAAFPDAADDAACPLCQQDLDRAAQERLARFQQFIGSDLRRQATDLTDGLKVKTEALPDLTMVAAAVRAELRGAPERLIEFGEERVQILETRLSAARAAAAGEPFALEEADFAFDELRVYAREQDDAAKRHASLRDEEAQRQVISQLSELQARVSFVKARETIDKHVAGLGSIARIDAAVAKLNTKSISIKLRELQEVAITDRLRKAIVHEVRELDPIASQIEITGQASKGETVIRLRFKEPCGEKISNVLSDGEQRALSLAFFLAEVAVSDDRSAVIFDDPVSSLDHTRRAYLAERLVDESARRQVVVFTHDMAFIHLLQEAADQAAVELHGQTLQRAFHRVGIVTGELPTKMLGTAKQIRALQHRLKSELIPRHKRQEPSYEQEADRWVNDLRKAYDQVIEDTVLNGTVRRFSSHVRVQKLHDVKWTPQIALRIDREMRKASPKAHHEPLALHPAPHTPQQLAAMLDELRSLYEEMSPNGDQSTAVEAAIADAEPVVRAAAQTQT